jgi:hypothetical protein
MVCGGTAVYDLHAMTYTRLRGHHEHPASTLLTTCSHVLCVLAATSGCGGGTSGGPATSDGAMLDGAMLGRIPTSHRASDIQCAQSAPAGTCPCNANRPSSSYPDQWACSSDSDCVDAGANGRCISSIPLAGCVCSSDSCTGDTDCQSGETCACHGSPYMFGRGNLCVPGNCQVDADCGTGGYCSPTPALPCNMNGRDFYCQGRGYYCHTPKDECVDDSDCQGVGFPGCLYDQSAGYWKCEVYAQPV